MIRKYAIPGLCAICVLAAVAVVTAMRAPVEYELVDEVSEPRTLHLPEGLTIAEYIRQEQIGYILYPDEMDLIYAQRPVWNDVYGNLYPYYDDLQEFLETECTVVAEIPAPVYAMRLVPYAGKSDYRVRVFRVDFRVETAPSAQETSR